VRKGSGSISSILLDFFRRDQGIGFFSCLEVWVVHHRK